MKVKVLYVEDEEYLGQIVKETLESQGFTLKWVKNGSNVIKSLEDFSPDICVLDIMLPGVDGYTLCEHIHKKDPGLPIIFLTAKVETSDLVKGFEAGGSDYIRKPFSIEELIVRIKHQLSQRSQSSSEKNNSEDSEIKLGKYTFLPGVYELHSPTQKIKLSQRDKQILELLIRNLNRVTNRREILMTVWGDDSYFNSRNLDVYIRKLRDYLGEDKEIQIRTLKGKGYLFLVREDVK